MQGGPIGDAYDEAPVHPDVHDFHLQDAHNWLRLAQAAGGIGVFSLDLDTELLSVSPEFCRIFGFPACETLASSDVERRCRVEGDTAMPTPGKRKTGEIQLNAEYPIRRADTGEVRWISRSAEFMFDEDGRPSKMLGVVQDITDRKAADAALADSENQFRTIAHSMPNQVWAAAPNGALNWFSEKTYDYLGLGYDALAGDGWAQCVWPDDLPAAAARWSEAIREGSLYETEFRIRRNDGVYRWHIVRAVPIRDDHGNISRWIGTNTDIEEQKSTQTELARLNAILETQIEERTRERDDIWNLSQDPLLVAGTDGKWLSVSPAWTRILGWSTVEFLGRSSEWLEHPDDRGLTDSALGSLPCGGTKSFENKFRAKNGSYRWFSWTAHERDGRLYCVARDITEQKMRQAELELAQDQLRQAQKIEAIGQLTGGIAHDFNNLLMVISGGLEMMDRHKDAARRTRLLGGMRQAVERGSALTRQLLAFSRRQALRPEPIDLARQIGGMRDLLDRSLSGDVHVETRFAPDLWPVEVDAGEFELVLLNLCVNARDAMPAGGTIVVAAENAGGLADHELHGDFVRICVVDTGFGMLPEVLAHAFEPFFTTKDVGKGSGLGLPQVYGFAKQSGGIARIESEVGRGTTVTLLLPRTLKTPDNMGVQMRDADIADIAPLSAGAVLLVEDDEEVAALVTEILGHLGYDVTRAASAAAALGALANDRPIDIVFSDIMMPGGMNGLDLAREIRRRRPNLPVLLTSGYADAIRHEAQTADIEVLAKPYRADQLAAALARVMAHAKTAR